MQQDPRELARLDPPALRAQRGLELLARLALLRLVPPDQLDYQERRDLLAPLVSLVQAELPGTLAGPVLLALLARPVSLEALVRLVKEGPQAPLEQAAQRALKVYKV